MTDPVFETWDEVEEWAADARMNIMEDVWAMEPVEIQQAVERIRRVTAAHEHLKGKQSCPR